METHKILSFPLFLELHCSKPDILHGKEVYKSRNDYSVGTEVRLACEEGFVLRGSESITCGADLTWEPELPFCDKGMCDTQGTRDLLPPVGDLPAAPAPGDTT